MKTDEMRNAKLIYIPAWVTYLSHNSNLTTKSGRSACWSAKWNYILSFDRPGSSKRQATVIERREFSAEKDVGEKCGSV